MTEKTIVVCDARRCKKVTLKQKPDKGWEKFRRFHFCPRHGENLRQVAALALSRG